MTTRFPVAAVAAILVAGVLLGTALQRGAVGHAQTDRRVFEIRTYTAHPGKLDALNARFRNHTVRLFRKHGLISVGYWIPLDAPLSENTLIYVLAHPDREAAKRNWDAFRKDPDWVKARTASEAKGPLVIKVDSVFLHATEYSPLR